MKCIFAFLLSLLMLTTSVCAYPQLEFDNCITSSKENTALGAISDKNIEIIKLMARGIR